MSIKVMHLQKKKTRRMKHWNIMWIECWIESNSKYSHKEKLLWMKKKIILLNIDCSLMDHFIVV